MVGTKANLHVQEIKGALLVGDVHSTHFAQKTKMAHASFPRLKKKQVSLDDMAVMVRPRTKKSSHHTMHSYTIALQRTLAKNIDASSTWRVQNENDQNRKISRA